MKQGVSTKERAIKEITEIRQMFKDLQQFLYSVSDEYLLSEIYDEYQDIISTKVAEDDRGIKICLRSIDLLLEQIEKIKDDYLTKGEAKKFTKRIKDLADTFNDHCNRSQDFWLKDIEKINKEIISKHLLDEEGSSYENF